MFMKTRQFFDFFIALAAFLFLSGCSGTYAKTLKRADTINEATSKPGYSLPALSALAKGISDNEFSTAKIKRYSDTELTRLYKALSTITFSFPEDENHVAMQEKVFQEKLARHLSSEYDIKNMYKTFLAARMFDKARGIKNQFPDIKLFSMPETIISNNPTGATLWRVYNVLDEGKTIELKVLPLDKGPKVVMVMLPGCAMGEAAMEEIMADPNLAPVFIQYGTVITNRVNAESVALWKSHFNFQEVYLAYKASDFPGLDFTISPHFYFLQDGKIISQSEGWGGTGDQKESRNDLLKGFRGISISTATTVGVN